MALTQLNFRLPRWQKRKLVQFAEDDEKTLEGFLQDLVDAVLDARLDVLETEHRIVADFIDHHRNQQKFNHAASSGV